MFNINKLLNRISDPKNQSSPTKPPTETAQDEEAEGFLCPTCFHAFPSAEALQNHYETSHGNALPEAGLGSRTSLVCPACKMRLGSEPELQSHYTRHHTTQESKDDLSNGEDVVNLKQELSELHTSLKEERWYSDELKREVSRLQDAISSKGDIALELAESEMLRSQVRALEEGKALLTSEVLLLRQQLGQAGDTSAALQVTKEQLEQRLAVASQEAADFKSRLDELEGQKAALESHLLHVKEKAERLDSELSQRSGAEDALVLKQELVSVQRAMDQLTLEREVERDKLKAENALLLEHSRTYREEKASLEEALLRAPRQEEIDSLRAALDDRSSSSGALQQALQQHMDEVKELRSTLKQQEEREAALRSELSSCTQRLEASQTALESQRADLVRSRDDLAAEKNSSQQLASKLAQLEGASKDLGAQNSKLSNEILFLKTSTQSALESKNGEVAELKQKLAQLSSELGKREYSLSELSTKLEKEIDSHESMRESRDSFKAEAWEKQMKVEELTRQLETRESKMSDQEEELAKIKESLVRLEAERAELYGKIESGEGASTLAMQQLTQENASLQDQVLALEKASERASQEHGAKVETLHQQLQETKTQLQAVMGEQQKLEKCCSDLEESLTSSRSREHKLQEDLKCTNETLSAAEAMSATRLSELEKSKAMLEECAKEANQLSEKMQSLTGELHAKRCECSDLESGLAEEKQRVARAESKSASLEDKLGAKCQALATLTAEKQTLQLKVEEADKRLAEARAKADKREEQQNEQLEKLEAEKKHLEETLLDKVEQTRALQVSLQSTQADLKAAEENLASTLESFTQQKTELESRLADCKSRAEAESTELKEQLAQLQNSLSSTQGMLGALKLQVQELGSERQQLASDLAGERQKGQLLVEERGSLQSSRDALESEVKELRDLLSASREEAARFQNDLEQTVVQVARLTAERKDLEAQLVTAESQLGDLRLHIVQADEEAQSIREELASSRAAEADLGSTLESLNQIKQELSDKLMAFDLEATSLRNENNTLADAKAALQDEVKKQEETLRLEEKKRLELEARFRELRTQLEEDTKAAAKELLRVKGEAKGQLAAQKAEMDVRLGELMAERASAQEELRATREQLQSELNASESRASQLKLALDEERQKCKQQGVEWESEKARYEARLTALSDNLDTFRGDLASERTRRESAEAKLDGLSGDKLELEAKLENTLDERRALLDRCLRSEAEVDTLRATTADLRKKLDDSVAALHELGRENQALQMDNAKYQGRKWADDSQVAHCTGCQKQFTVTIRKHHCRNCGNIFCNECSARSATIPSSKKPVRVCDGCFAEVTQ